MSDSIIEVPDDETIVVTLAAEVTAEHARPLRNAIAGAIEGRSRLVVEAAALHRLDAAALQVLVSAAREVKHATLREASPAWLAALARYGIADPLSTETPPAKGRSSKRRPPKSKATRTPKAP